MLHFLALFPIISCFPLLDLEIDALTLKTTFDLRKVGIIQLKSRQKDVLQLFLFVFVHQNNIINSLSQIFI